VLELTIFYRSVETHNKPILYIQYAKREQNNFRTSYMLFVYYKCVNCIGGVMVSVLAASVVDHGSESWPGQTKDYTIGICSYSAKHAALRRKSNNWSARNQDNVSELDDMSAHGLLFQWASTINIQLSVLV
jgi:hypothetical protein